MLWRKVYRREETVVSQEEVAIYSQKGFHLPVIKTIKQFFFGCRLQLNLAVNLTNLLDAAVDLDVDVDVDDVAVAINSHQIDHFLFFFLIFLFLFFCSCWPTLRLDHIDVYWILALFWMQADRNVWRGSAVRYCRPL